jgi:hypothetical protein
MRLPTLTVRRTRRLLPLLGAALLLAVLVGPATVQAAGAPSSTVPSTVGQETTTSSTTTASSPTTASSQTTTGQAAIIPPSAVQVPLNPGWKTDQLEIRVMPEYDQPMVLVIMGFTLPADVPLPATLKFPIPAGAKIAGIGEVDPSGNFTYNYKTKYPTVEPGTDWDIATIEVTNYRKLQIDYYYDPGFPQGAGPRSFQVLAQIPMDVGTLLLHIQQPARSTGFKVDPALEASGKADDGYTYAVGTYTGVKAGSTLGHVVSYTKSDGGLSTDTSKSGSTTQVSTNTVLLAAILVLVICIGGIVVYSLFFRSRKPGPKKGPVKAQKTSAATSPAATKRQKPAAKGPTVAGTKPEAAPKATVGAMSGATSEGAATPTEAAPATGAATTDGAATAGAETTDTPATTDVATDQGGEVAPEYCVACGEELTTESPFCPNCGEARR